MAFVEGMSLHEKVKDAGPLQPKRAAELMKTVAVAVQFGHDKGIVPPRYQAARTFSSTSRMAHESLILALPSMVTVK